MTTALTSPLVIRYNKNINYLNTQTRCLWEGRLQSRYNTTHATDTPRRNQPQGSYYDRYNRPTAALYRARQPYLIRNIFTGLGIMGFAIGVCSSPLTLLFTMRLNRGARPSHLDILLIYSVGQTRSLSAQFRKTTLRTSLYPILPESLRRHLRSFPRQARRQV